MSDFKRAAEALSDAREIVVCWRRLKTDPPGMRTKTWTGYAAKPRLSRYSMGLSAPREIFIRFSLYQRMYESKA